jgi:hypothetical protein
MTDTAAPERTADTDCGRLKGFARSSLSNQEVSDLRAELAEAKAEVARLDALINTPTTDDWLTGVQLEAAHQIERWGAQHDVGKSPFDWFWLIGYLSQKAASAAVSGDDEKAKHHTISTAAALLNWHRAIANETTVMRPGIDPIVRGVEVDRASSDTRAK